MKKQWCFVLGLTFAAGRVASAEVLSVPGTYATLRQEKVEVKAEDLPEAIKKALKEDPYTGWEVLKAYKVQGPGNTTMYELELKKGEDMLKVSFNESGKKIV